LGLCPLLDAFRPRLFFTTARPTEEGPEKEDEENTVFLIFACSCRLSESDDEDEVEGKRLKCCFRGDESEGIVIKEDDEDDEDDKVGDIMVTGPVVKVAVALGENSMICSRAGDCLWVDEGRDFRFLGVVTGVDEDDPEM
jgi:hypothetical protein